MSTSNTGRAANEITKKRSRRGCLTCRSRKVKCDEVQRQCGQCKALSLQCSWPADLDAGPSKRANIGKPRHSACMPCRAAKARCDRLQIDDVCQRCDALNLECAKPSSPTPARDAERAASTIRCQAPSPTELLEIIEIYFSQVQPSDGIEFIHRGSFMRDFVDGQVPALLLQSILLVTGRFLPSASSDNMDGGEDLAKLATELKGQIMADTDQFSLVKVAVLLNIRIHEQNAGRHGSVWLLISLITRMAYGLGLNTERTDVSSTEAEVRSRLMWAAYAADSQAAGGIMEYTLTDRRNLSIPLPASERAFALGLSTRGRSIELVEFDPARGQDGTEGIASRFIRLIALRNDILSYTKYIRDFAPYAWEPGSRFDTICEKLRCWETSLPVDLQMNVECLYALKGQPGSMSLLACLHIWFDQLHSTLYRTAYPGFDESAPADYLAQAPPQWIDKLRRGCYHRAIEVRQKIRFLSKHKLYFKMAGHRISSFAFECIRNQLAYIKYAFPEGEGPNEYLETLRGFEDIVTFFVHCSTGIITIKLLLKRIIALLDRHGYALGQLYPMSASETRPASPAQGMILARLPFVQGILRHPHAEQSLSPQRPIEKRHGVDPVTERPLSHSLDASSDSIPGPSQIYTGAQYENTFSLFSELLEQQAAGLINRDGPDPPLPGQIDNDLLASAGIDPWAWGDIDLWNALVPTSGGQAQFTDPGLDQIVERHEASGG